MTAKNLLSGWDSISAFTVSNTSTKQAVHYNQLYLMTSVMSMTFQFHQKACTFMGTVEPPNKGHFGPNINYRVLSLVERLSFSRRFDLYENNRKLSNLGPRPMSFVERFTIQCPVLSVSTIGGSTVYLLAKWVYNTCSLKDTACKVGVHVVC